MLTREEYEEKRQARYERLIAAAERAQREGEASRNQARQMAEVIPFGQPILVGHYSEGRDRRYRARIDSKFRKGYELHKKAEEYRSRAASAQSNDAIYSDNPDAVDLLTDKVTELEKEQAEIKRINAALRKGADFDTLEMSEEHRRELLVIDRVQAYYQPRKRGFPPYKLSNLSAKIRAAKQRAENVEKKQALHDEDFEVNGVKVEGRPSENRIRLDFGGRVDREMFAKLRQNGFRATKEAGVFSAYYNNRALYFVKTQIMKKEG